MGRSSGRSSGCTTRPVIAPVAGCSSADAFPRLGLCPLVLFAVCGGIVAGGVSGTRSEQTLTKSSGASPLNLVIQRRRRAAALACQVARIALETGEPLPSAPSLATPAGDRERLRGIPCACGRGIGGTMRGTQPEQAIVSRSDEIALVRSLAVLSSDLDGTSPGTQPEQALLEAEEQTLAYEPHQRLEQRAARFVPTRHLVSSSGGDRARRP
jgi:hypothetical protein